MLRIFFIAFFSFIFIIGRCFAQDTLPNISVKNYYGKIIISWENNYGAQITTLNIQRSNDSLKNFTTFASVLNPANKENGLVDSKPLNPKMFYRVFVVFDGGNYFFSKSHRPTIDSFKTVDKTTPNIFYNLTFDSLGIKKSIKIPAPTPVVLGKYIFTGKDNNVIISLADAPKRKYSIKFFDNNEHFIFEVKKIAEPYLILDKVNFLHAGLFNYELYDNGILLEKYRVIIQKDSRPFKY